MHNRMESNVLSSIELEAGEQCSKGRGERRTVGSEARPEQTSCRE
jgi:hypothetical protein